jgi:Uncharacterized conserved protein
VTPLMVPISGGTFAMGSNDDPSEKPIHRVTIKPFSISKFPITVREWNECVAAKVCSDATTGKDDAPATNLSWNDAQEFVTWLSRLGGKQFRLRPRRNGNMPRAQVHKRDIGGAISCNPTWPIARGAAGFTNPHNR